MNDDLDAIGERHRRWNEIRFRARMNGIRALEIHECEERRKAVSTEEIVRCDVSGKIMVGHDEKPEGFTLAGMVAVEMPLGQENDSITARLMFEIDKPDSADVCADEQKKALASLLAAMRDKCGIQKARRAKPAKEGDAA